jgi:hypothetical protein
MRLHEGIFRAHVFGQVNSHRRWCLTRFPSPFEGDAHGVGMRRAMREGVLNGCLQFAWTEAVEQSQQFPSHGTQIAAACRRAYEQLPTGRHRVGEVISTAMLARFTFVGNEGCNVALIFDLCSAIVAPWMLGN